MYIYMCVYIYVYIYPPPPLSPLSLRVDPMERKSKLPNAPKEYA